jgi:anti-sigma regulatory factor (Ser/Thr protein kinase)
MEALHLSALRRYRILDMEPECRIDDLALLASHACGASMALITLVDGHRQWFKSRVGVPAADTSGAVSFCAHAITPQDLFIIPDTLQDERFRNHPQVTSDPHIRFYAGAPLVAADGRTLGSLCVFDSQARVLTADQRAALDALRRQVESQLELRRNLMELDQALAARSRADAADRATTGELRARHENLRRLSALVPLCSTCEFTMTIPADPAVIPVVTEGVVELLEERAWAKEDVLAIQLALQEAVANAIRHGCRGDASRQVRCSVSCDDSGEVLIVVRDPGSGFDPGAIADPLVTANILKPSGRGIFLMNELMDHVWFADGGREVQMRKKKTNAPDLMRASR